MLTPPRWSNSLRIICNVIHGVSACWADTLQSYVEQDSGGMVELGTDICVSGKQSQTLVAYVVFAQFRR